MSLCESMNFHPDKQLFQVAGAGDQTTDPWITRPVLYPYTTGTHSKYFLCMIVLLFAIRKCP